MRYDEKTKKIIITAGEFVATARRAVATSVPSDIEEPELRTVSKRLLLRTVGKPTPVTLTYDFDCAGYSFLLKATVEHTDGCKLWFTTEVDSDPKRPKKAVSGELRGEGYVSAYAYAIQNNLTRVELNYIFYSPERNTHAKSSESVTLEKLRKFFDKCIGTVSVYAKPEIERVTVRLPSMRSISFPYKEVREGQRDFISVAYRNIARGGTLYATAPTGTGKTVSALFPALRAMGNGKRDKTFYLTPKDTTANAAIECLLLLAERGAVIRAIKLSAKEKCCKNGLLCRENRDRCEYSKCNKLSDAALALYNKELTVALDEDIQATAKEYRVCAYELSLTYAELCDVVICDFNYLFDPTVYIRRFFTEGGNYIFLVDEAHNLPDRAREMYSAEISDTFILSALDCPYLGEFSETRKAAQVCADSFFDTVFPLVKEEIRESDKGERNGAAHTKELPSELYEIFDSLLITVEEEIYQNYKSRDEEKNDRIRFLQGYYYKLKRFRAVMERFDSSYELFVFFSDNSISVKLFCIDPGREISERLSLGRAAVFFSATLTPLYYYRSILGGDSTSDTLAVESPFDREQLSVSIMDKISTRFIEREDTASAVCRVIAATVSARRGNYMIFSPSFAYSEMLAKSFQAKYPKIKVLLQKKNMTKAERDDFLLEFSKDESSYLIGFCVMGGIYSEGIDLVGDSLIGAVIVGIGMPSLSYEREAICAYYDDKYEEGKQFAYIYPGMNRVLQAAGRVIRREDDRGVIVLIDDRFDDPIYKKIIPALWSGMKFIGDAKALRENLDKFWQEK